MKNALNKLAGAIESLAANARFYVFLGILFTFIFVMWAFLLGVGQVEFPGTSTAPLGPDIQQKEVGYWLAPNWTWAGLTLSCAGYFLLNTINEFSSAVDGLMKHKMIITRDGNLIRQEELDAKIGSRRRWAIAFALIFAVAMAAGVVLDLKTSVFDVLNHGSLAGIKFSDPNKEFDWSVSCLFQGSEVSCGSLKPFVIAAYAIIPGILACVAFGSFIYITILSTSTFGATGRRGEFRLRPNLDSSDTRKGFEELEPLFENMTIGLGFSLISIYFMSVQNIYLRQPNIGNIADYFGSLLKSNLAALQESGLLKQISTFVGHFGGGRDSLQSVEALMLAAAISLLAGITFYWSLRASAKEARRFAIAEIDDALAVAKPPAEQDTLRLQRAALEKMKYWPLRWASLLALSAAAIVLTFAVFFPSLLSMAILALVIVAIKFLVAKIKKLIPGLKPDDDKPS